jgi:hypothetical protein
LNGVSTGFKPWVPLSAIVLYLRHRS